MRFLPALLLLAAATANAQSIDQLGQDLLLRSGSTGLVLVVVHDKETTLRGFGETAPGNRQPPAADSLLRLCSLTKIFATDLLVKVIQQPTGLFPIKLETPLQLVAHDGLAVPRFADNPRPVTLGDLATHTAGLPRELGPAPRGVGHFTFPSQAQRWRALPTLRLHTAPGTAAAYSNLGFDLLGDALEQATQIPYPQLLAQRTLNPLAMVDTTFTPTDAQCARLLGGAHPEGQCNDTSNTAGSSGLYSTGTDMARWLQYLLYQQPPAAQAAYLLPASLASVQGLDHAGDPIGIGLGWVHTMGTNNAEIIEKTGGGAGFLTYIAMLPAQHLAIFIAATDGGTETYINLFRNANNILLTLAGLPTVYIAPPPPPTAAHNLKAMHTIKARRKR